MPKDLPLWRSMLFVPTVNERFVAGAAARGADAIMLDLEDSVPPDRKAEARARLQEAARQVGARGSDVLVRVNRPWRLLLPDLEASVGGAVTGVVLPKVPHAQHVQAVAEILGEIEGERGLADGHTRIVAMIETAAGLFRASEIAAAHPRVAGVTIGAEDLAVSLGGRPGAASMTAANLQALWAARAAGVLPIGYVGSVADYADADAFRRIVRQSREIGFAGGFCVHPSQVAILNEEHAPTDEEAAAARDVVAAYQQALAKGLGAIAHGGRMLDRPIVEQAESVLARWRAIAARKAT